MKHHALQNCPACTKPVPATSRFCPHCGTIIREPTSGEDDIIISSANKNLRVSADTLDIQELLAIVEGGISWWKQHIQETEGVAREQAAATIKQLSQVLDSLSQQLGQGRTTIRITTRLPTLRSYSVGCPACGAGNRAGARFCQMCGSLILDPQTNNKQVLRPSLVLQVASRSDVGQVRQNNEDTILTTKLTMPKGETATLLLVADGMGGAQAGEEASRLATETKQQQLQQSLQHSAPTDTNDWAQRLQTALQTANTRIYKQAQAHPDQRGMGTTCTFVVVVGQNAYLGHVGDSRAYLINTNGVTEDGAQWVQLTADHTLVARLVDIGHLSQAEAKLLPQRNMLYRALGAEATIEGDTGSQPLELGDILLLCSDGLTNFVHEHELSNLVMQAANLEDACKELVTLANSRGGRDNISVVVARVESIKC